MDVHPARSSRHRPSLKLSASLGVSALLGGVLLGGGTAQAQDEEEIFPVVEIDPQEAAGAVRAEVSGGRIASMELVAAESVDPVWRSEVVTGDGGSLVEVDATQGEVLGTRQLPPEETERDAALLDEAELRPEEAVEEVTDPDFGKVTDVELRRTEDGVVWTVDVVTITADNAQSYDVDAQSGEPLQRREVGAEGDR